MAGPFKMKGSPFQRNFGIGSPLHQDEKKIKMLEGTTIFGKTPKNFLKTAKKKVEDVLGITTIKSMGKVVRDVYKDLRKDTSHIKRRPGSKSKSTW